MSSSNRKTHQEPTHTTNLEKKVNQMLAPIEEFCKSQITASIFLLSATVIAVIFASIPTLTPYYEKIIDYPIHILLGGHKIGGSLHFWVNDFLLTFFFFLLGLEIKHEFIAGALVNRKRALLIICAATGGMLFPAGIFILLNLGSSTLHGWGIPVATDTAFALGLLAMFRRKLPDGVFAFLVALAIIDDIGAITIIAIFYTHNISFWSLITAFLLLLFLGLANYAGVRNKLFYLLFGFAIWAAFEHAGIHGVIAGVLVALCIPARPAKRPKNLINKIENLLDNFKKRKKKASRVIEDKTQHVIIKEIEKTALKATTPLQDLETKLDVPISLIVLPLFALLNAGISVDPSALEKSLSTALTWGIILGLFVGKPVGITLFSYLAVKLNIGVMPKSTNFKHLFGVSLFCGIGFTMSLFIGNLAFSSQNNLILMSKSGILLGSLLSGLLGVVWLKLTKPVKNPKL